MTDVVVYLAIFAVAMVVGAILPAVAVMVIVDRRHSRRVQREWAAITRRMTDRG